MRKLKKWMAMLGTLVCVLSLMTAPVYADTDGTELQVADSSRLEIQLGPGWSGVEFQMRTDAGMYPDTIAVDEDGVLRLEIGGSSIYTLTCLNSAVEAPQAPAAEPKQPDMAEDATEAQDSPSQSESETVQDGSSSTEMSAQEEGVLAGIPVMHIVLFGGGLLLAVGGLVAMRIVSRRKEISEEYDDEYDEED